MSVMEEILLFAIQGAISSTSIVAVLLILLTDRINSNGLAFQAERIQHCNIGKPG
jgi:hypothetical protein